MSESGIKYEYSEDSFYQSLQEKTRERLLGLSGKLWNGLYTHDPGLTINDVTNFLLTDLRYKLHFNIEDYLRTEHIGLKPHRIGLFTALLTQVKAPTTAADFQELMHSQIQEIHQIEFIPSREKKQWGTYQVKAQIYADTPEENEKGVQQTIRTLFYRYRNLCEDLGNISLTRTEEKRKPKKLYELDSFLVDKNLEYPSGTYRNVFNHIPARFEFPNFYGINDWGLSHETSTERKRQAEQLKVYLSLFDRVIERGLEELEMLPDLLQQSNTTIPPEKIPLKEQYLNLLDKLYGINSEPVAMLTAEGKPETPEERIVRRSHFLRKVYLWGRDRNKASLLNTQKEVFGPEEYLRTLFGLGEDEHIRLIEHTFLRYVPERIYSMYDRPKEFPFELALSIFLYGSTPRMKNSQFRKSLEMTVLKQIPAHLDGNVYWLSSEEMEAFETLYTNYVDSFRLDEQAYNGYSFSLEYGEALKEWIAQKREKPKKEK